MFPKVEINLSYIKYNANVLQKKCSASGIEIAAVTKLVRGDLSVVNVICESGIKMIADSRLLNFEKMSEINMEKLLLRIPMLSQIERVVDLVDISLNSEIETIRKISEVSKRKGKTHSIILMIDLGDLREGIIDDSLIDYTISETLKLDNVKILGIGTNLTCFGGVVPSNKNLQKLVTVKRRIESKYSIKLDVISGGNSGSLGLLSDNKMPKEVNQLRLGASILMGIGLNDADIPGLKQNSFNLVVEIVEIMEKPSIPSGEIGLDSFGNKPFFEDLGIRKKVICAIGRQDVSLEDITPFDKGIKMLGMSSDHLILDITDAVNNYSLGGLISFELSYGGVLSVMTSDYISKTYV